VTMLLPFVVVELHLPLILSRMTIDQATLAFLIPPRFCQAQEFDISWQLEFVRNISNCSA